MTDPGRIHDVVMLGAIVSACLLAWLSVRAPRVLSRWWFWSVIAGLLVVVVELAVGRP